MRPSSEVEIIKKHTLSTLKRPLLSYLLLVLIAFYSFLRFRMYQRYICPSVLKCEPISVLGSRVNTVFHALI